MEKSEFNSYIKELSKKEGFSFLKSMTKDEIKALIRRRRAQMLVHSFLYYHQDNPIWSDDEWQQKADESEPNAIGTS